MRQVNKELTLEEKASRYNFFGRIKPGDRSNVHSVIKAVDGVAHQYFHEYAGLEAEENIRGEPDLNYRAFRHSNDIGCAFFSVYAIGGQITKQGERPDIDLMIVTNMWWSGGYIYDKDEWMHEGLVHELGDKFNIHCEDKLPNHYNEGLIKNKALIRLMPKYGKYSFIDIVYVRSLHKGNDEDKFISPADFEKRDVDENGMALPRLILYRASTSDITPPGIGW